MVRFDRSEELARLGHARADGPAACGILQSAETCAAERRPLLHSVLESAGKNRLADALAVMGMETDREERRLVDAGTRG